MTGGYVKARTSMGLSVAAQRGAPITLVSPKTIATLNTTLRKFFSVCIIFLPPEIETKEFVNRKA
jgi:hypothetical protein